MQVKEDKTQSNNIKNDIKNAKIRLALLEKIGSAFLSAGYSIYILGSNADIDIILNLNPSLKSSEGFFILGQKLVFLGYFILFKVSQSRLQVKEIENQALNKNDSLDPFMRIRDSYLLSAVANLYRLEAFIELQALEVQEQENEKEDNTDD